MTRGLDPSLTCVLLVLGILACGGEQRSGAAPGADTSRTSAGDTVSVGDTATRNPTDTGVSATTDSARPGRDTASALAAKPAPRKPRAPRRVAPSVSTTDTSAAASPAQPATPAPSAPSDTIAASASPSDTTSTPTSDTTSTPTAGTTSTPAPQTTAAAPLRDEYHRAPLDTVSQQVYDGWKQYNLNCARCHGEDVLGTTIAPHLLVSVKPDGPINTKEAFMKVVCEGRPEKGMPSWCALGMDTPKIEAIHAYVKGRSDAKLRPGRPALRGG